jgi:mevalonate kinase
MSFSMHTNGKLLLTGEYFVTDGAVALALPTKLGQQLEVEEQEEEGLTWQSLDENGECWFECHFSLPRLAIKKTKGEADKAKVAQQLQHILRQAKKQNPSFLKGEKALKATTKLDFDRQWGLGTSSTLVTMIAEWAQIDPFVLLEETFGGSGYDIVAAKAEGPVLFQKFNEQNRWDKASFDPVFKDNLYFVYLGKKQNSREAMVYYSVTPEEERCQSLGRITQITHDIARNAVLASQESFQPLSSMTQNTPSSGEYEDELKAFEALIAEHEDLVQEVIQQPRAKTTYFADYWGEIKSLGGWGGDFVLATSTKTEEETKAYFNEKGYETVLAYSELIKEY